MAFYDFKCNECGNIKEDVYLSMANFDTERKSVLCCGVQMQRFYSPEKLTGIRTTSSPSRF